MNTDYRRLSEQHAFSPRYFPRNTPLLRREEVHIWRVSLNLPETQIQNLLYLLASDERRRAETFHFNRDRNHFITARGMLRKIIGNYLNIDPSQLCFCCAANGKPVLAAPIGNEDLYFNLSHSKGLALYGITLGRRIGIDLEFIRADMQWEKIAKHFFSAKENDMLFSQPVTKQIETFFSYWTGKEAYIKATGRSFLTGMNQLDFSAIPSGEKVLLKSCEGESCWTLQKLSVDNGYAATVAVEGHHLQLKYYQYRFSL